MHLALRADHDGPHHFLDGIRLTVGARIELLIGGRWSYGRYDVTSDGRAWFEGSEYWHEIDDTDDVRWPVLAEAELP